MAIKKISELTEFTGTVAADDYLPIVDTSAVETKRIAATLFKGDKGDTGTVAKYTTTDISNPTELNSMDDSSGTCIIIEEATAASNYFSLYVWDASNTDSPTAPYIMAGDGGTWILIGGTNYAPVAHNGLQTLQGGITDEYYHISEAVYNTVSADGTSVSLAALEIDMETSGIFTKTISSNSTFTISNPVLDRVVVVRLTGDYDITLPATVKNKTTAEDTYNGAKVCTLFIYCIDASTPEYWSSVLVGD